MQGREAVMQRVLKRWLCQHAMYWSDRRQGDVCYKCGKFRSAMLNRALTLPERDPRRTISIRFPTVDRPDRPDSMPGFSHSRTARD